MIRAADWRLKDIHVFDEEHKRMIWKAKPLVLYENETMNRAAKIDILTSIANKMSLHYQRETWSEAFLKKAKTVTVTDKDMIKFMDHWIGCHKKYKNLIHSDLDTKFIIMADYEQALKSPIWFNYTLEKAYMRWFSEMFVSIEIKKVNPYEHNDIGALSKVKKDTPIDAPNAPLKRKRTDQEVTTYKTAVRNVKPRKLIMD